MKCGNRWPVLPAEIVCDREYAHTGKHMDREHGVDWWGYREPRTTFGREVDDGDYWVEVQDIRLHYPEALRLYHQLGEWLVAVGLEQEREA